MNTSDRKLNVPKPKRTRDVSGFGTPLPSSPPADSEPAKTSPERSTPASAKRAGKRATPPPRRKAARTEPGDSAMVRVHATVSPAVADALRKRVGASGESHTEVLADAFLRYGGTLAAIDAADRARYEQMGFRPKQPKRSPGRMTATFYVSAKARRHVDQAAADGGFASRSSFIDALLSKELEVGEAP